jgi:hypothetical protein
LLTPIARFSPVIKNMLLPRWYLRKYSARAEDVAREGGQHPSPDSDTHAPTPPDFAQLEDRVLLSASPTGAFLDGGAPDGGGDAVAPPNGDNRSNVWTANALDMDSDSANSNSNELGQAWVQELRVEARMVDGVCAKGIATQELVFVDSDTQDYQQRVDDLLSGRDGERHVEVVVLESGRDGIDQITTILSGHENLDAVHLVSRGTDNAVKLGGTWLQVANMDARATQIVTWGDALSPGANLLIYGCQLSTGAAGQALIDGLSVLTGADVGTRIGNPSTSRFGSDTRAE